MAHGCRPTISIPSCLTRRPQPCRLYQRHLGPRPAALGVHTRVAAFAASAAVIKDAIATRTVEDIDTE